MHRKFNRSLAGARLRKHWRWRRRKRHYRAKWRSKRRLFREKQFLTPNPCGRTLWNHHRRVNREFLSVDSSSFLPFATYGLVPEEVIDEFVCDRGGTFLAAPTLLQHFGKVSIAEGAQETIGRLNLCKLSLGLDKGDRKKQTFKACPLVWDTGASFGLTPFRQDFIDYAECSIPVNDIARTNTVIGIGTTLHKFRVNGDDIFLPCLSSL